MKSKIVLKNVTTQVIQNPIYQSQPPNQQSQGPKIKGIKEVGKVEIDPSRSEYFKQLYSDTSASIRDRKEFRIEPFIHNNAQTFQYINFTFLGKNEYEGKAISGYLKLKSDHPKNSPEFYFYNMKNGETIQHENIYQGGLLCIVQINQCWKESMSISDVLEAVEYIFHNPNYSIGDAPANSNFAPIPENKKSQIRKQQAQLMEDFNQEDEL